MTSKVTTGMKTSIRLALTSLAVCGITFAASGKPLPFLPKADKPAIGTPTLLAPASVDGPTPGERIASARALMPGAGEPRS